MRDKIFIEREFRTISLGTASYLAAECGYDNANHYIVIDSFLDDLCKALEKSELQEFKNWQQAYHEIKGELVK